MPSLRQHLIPALFSLIVPMAVTAATMPKTQTPPDPLPAAPAPAPAPVAAAVNADDGDTDEIRRQLGALSRNDYQACILKAANLASGRQALQEQEASMEAEVKQLNKRAVELKALVVADTPDYQQLVTAHNQNLSAYTRESMAFAHQQAQVRELAAVYRKTCESAKMVLTDYGRFCNDVQKDNAFCKIAPH